MLRLLLSFGLLAASLSVARAQAGGVVPDTVRLTLPEAEQRFLENNLSLLAHQYNVSLAQAQAVQARLLDNPTVYVEQDVLRRKVLRPEVPEGTPGSEMIFSVQQLVSLAGRRKAAGKVAEQGAVVEQYNLQDLLRNLRYQLRTSYYDLFFKQQTLKVYDAEIKSLTRTVGLYQTQFEKGNIALKEVIRLRAFLFTLQSEQQAILAEMAAEQTDLHVLLRDPSGVQYAPVVSLARVRDLSLNGFAEQQLVDTAQVLRTDLNARRASLEQQNLNLRLQQKLVTPDVAVGYSYDRAGSYINNYHALTLGVALPVFNRNQGNIQAAKGQVAGSKLLVDHQQLQVQSEVRQAYQLAARNDQLFQSTNRDTAPFERLMAGIEQSYAKRLLTVVEYLDFFESYKNTLVQLNALRANRVRAFEQLNFVVGKPVFKAE
ncbi:TolC family protein [Hymenobacter arizonensis]|uniref:Outer membrane protein, cobalt-zinc-cadmium efflux system n=1 Tax=Hymenobacter arizonensis TaxID=1227077 RepID=A0A1I5T3M9_HYMAR|nr:TolC family protein [Hymenobacter arizonensis]SFP77237.1 outer membrane protein, cobalt-zinc-cadmium efflux system [Hymenobacter arizonensis]